MLQVQFTMVWTHKNLMRTMVKIIPVEQRVEFNITADVEGWEEK